ncbi:MAG: type II toxin-antitoxin system YafQ family toxin [Chloroflexi bacterium]|nr:type II toxin-antitoxin system YafQ family toxin [Chloroflexota bacterium]
MRKIEQTARFKKDVKRAKRRGKKFNTFRLIIDQLAKGQKLEDKYRDHALVGGYKGSRECHIEPDWLLIYELTEIELILIRTGTHTDLFR